MVRAGLAGALCGAGIITAVLALRGASVSDPPAQRRVGVGLARAAVIRTSAAGVTAVIVLAATGWVVMAFAAALGVATLPAALRNRRDRDSERMRVEAVAAWTEMLRDAVSSGRGVQEAIAVTAPLAPMAIRPAVLALRARSVRGPLAPALRTFTDEVDDPMADLVASALTLAATREVRELGDLLGALAQTTRQRAALRLSAEAGRAGLRTTARAIGGITAVAVAGLFTLQPDYLLPYSTPVGQLVLAAACSWFILGFWGLSRLGRPPRPRRLSLREATP